MAGKALSIEPTIDPSATVRDTKLGAYTEVGARTTLIEVAMGNYSYVVNDAQIIYTPIGKFCSIAAMTRINPGCLYRSEKPLLLQGFLYSSARSGRERPYP
jgi:hypothetical protein